jgi:hypothetical protein
MKSEPGRSVVRTSAVLGFSVSASFDIMGAMVRGGGGVCALAAPVLATSVAMVPAAAVFRKLRRSTDDPLSRAICPLDP